MQNRISVFYKKIATWFDKKIATWREKSIDEEKNLLLWTLKKKTRSLRTLKRILSMRNPKRTLITVKPKGNAIDGDPQEFQDPQWLLRRKLTLCSFLVMVYDRVNDGDKFSKNNFGLGRLRFHATSHFSHPYWRRDHKLFLFTWFIYRGCFINFK